MTETVGAAKIQTIGASKTETIGVNKSVDVGADQSTDIGEHAAKATRRDRLRLCMPPTTTAGVLPSLR